MSFESLGLEPRLLKGVAAMGYTVPTPIQNEAIPHVLAGRDVVGCAQTGTGKTAAFVLPLLQSIKPQGGIQALVVTPTRELAVQIGDVARDAGKFTGHRSVVIYGGVGYEPQLQKLRRGVDLVVATPGRLLDIQNRGSINLSKVKILVLDEADRMLDMGFWPDVRKIIALLPTERQNLLFSATMSSDVMRIAGSTLKDAVHIETSPTTKPVEKIHQAIYPVNQMQKAELLVELLKGGELNRVLVFTRTKHRADRVHRILDKAGISAAAIHGDRSQSQRQNALDGFKRGSTRVLVATDIVARGIDVEEISHVINYDMPNSAEDYVHRIGRTARAGAEGSAISFLAAEETSTLHEIERALGEVLVCEDHHGFDYKDRVVPMADRTVNTKSRAVFSSGVMGRRGGGGRRIGRR
ncbi:MAG: DEAD/DEAH box helicase [Actinomycetota bacterium]|nr:MAG: ATP-dependent RNA helicase [Actinomycetota bacterium]MDO8950345.1 DEAD/DEAH box helicase [Actinomycetota bacterium]MDP3629419.1 DEAD/DEAH box helicase [Actinomycetota bacterium]